ncbi:hypothetical protein J7I93_01675 [Bacillus sp. ISL-47]|uniref:CsxC family protein n=1 Tax=Bacillus sp. ISL-47 TaxID=2819130 RepID=UPI001BEA4B8F|nr:hypothetical protein [Bacillus sp. ISL-47]MBT2686884.1 hypothetical protein [Bacillus sp. ISL-47]MBT2710423.1 hypothetical protein [Pseudomonas sp. ISL-84]
MKKCGCGKGHDHGKCPAMPACDTAKSHGHFCEAGTVLNPGEVEETIILGDVPVQALTESDICLPSYATDIKVIRKNVYLTQCRAIPAAPDADDEEGTTTNVKLFIEGYIHKNIQYVEDCEGYVKDYSVNVPFKCYTRVTDLAPIPVPLFSSKNSTNNEIREIAKDGMGANRCAFGSNTFEFLNEPIKCKLISWNLTEADYLSNFDKWGRFDKFVEKDDINLVLRLTQKQFVDVPPTMEG